MDQGIQQQMQMVEMKVRGHCFTLKTVFTDLIVQLHSNFKITLATTAKASMLQDKACLTIQSQVSR